MIEEVLRGADRPLSLNQIKFLLPRAVMHATLREALEHYKRLGCVTEGSKGVMWTAGRVQPVREGQGLDLGSLPTFTDEDAKASLRHDKYLYG